MAASSSSVVLKKLTRCLVLHPTSACASFSKQHHHYHTEYGFTKSFKNSMIDDVIKGKGFDNEDANQHLAKVFNKGFINHYSQDDCISLVERRPPNYFDAYDRFLTTLYFFISNKYLNSFKFLLHMVVTFFLVYLLLLLFSLDTIHPLSATRILKRNLNIAEKDIKWWDVKETPDAVCLVRKTPGDVEVSVEKNTPLSDKSIDDNPGFFYFGLLLRLFLCFFFFLTKMFLY